MYAQNSWSYEFSDISAQTVVISSKTVKEAKNTICDTCSLNLQSYEFSDTSAYTVVRRRKTVNLS